MPVPDWSRIASTTIHQFIREVEVNILRNRKLLAMMQSRGRITFNHGGDLMDWPVKYKRAPIQGYADSDTLTFTRKDRWKKAQLEWRGYAATDSMTKLERLKNKGTEAIIKVYEEIVSNLMEDIEEEFSNELYIDGNATGNSKRIHGIESFMSASGAATNGFIASPNDSYAGLDCTLGNYGGSWSQSGGATEWPTGTGDAHYDFWSPLLVDYTDTLRNASTKTWANTCKEALRYGILKSKKNMSKKGQMDLILANDELYRLFLNKLDDEERLTTQRGDGAGLYNLGFSDTVVFDGVDVTSEYGVSSGLAYGWSMDNLELRSLQGQLFVSNGPDEDISTQSSRFSIDFFGNMRFNPRYFVKFKAYT